MADFSQANPALRGYIDEMEAQLKLMSTRAANMSAALRLAQHQLAKAQEELAKLKVAKDQEAGQAQGDSAATQATACN